MKKTLLTLATFAYLLPGNLFGQCTLYIDYGDTTLCQGDSTTLTAVTPSNTNNITTTYAAGNNHRGNMFDVVAINEITVESVDAHPMANTTIEIYYKVGAFAGFENNAAAWTLVGSAAVTAQPQGTPTAVPVPINVTIPAGQTYAFYVTSSNVAVSLNYTDGTAQGAVYVQDANVQILQGVGLEYPFSGSPFTPRMWNGTVHYSVAGSGSYLWSNGATTPTITVTPSTTTTYSVDVNIGGCPLMSDSVQVSVYSVSADLGADTTICVYNSIILDAGGGGANSYVWSTAETTPTITIDGATQGIGTAYYSVTVTNQNSCEAMDSVAITVDQCAGISEYELSRVKVYPNPAVSMITLESHNAAAEYVEIYSLTGSLIKTITLSAEKTQAEVNEFNNGMYYYKVMDNRNNALHTGKIIVKK